MLLFVERLRKGRTVAIDEEESLQVYKQAERKWIKHGQKEILNSVKYQQMKSTLGLYQDSERMILRRGKIG